MPGVGPATWRCASARRVRSGTSPCSTTRCTCAAARQGKPRPFCCRRGRATNEPEQSRTRRRGGVGAGERQRLAVDLEELATAFENGFPELSYYLDLDSGAVVM